MKRYIIIAALMVAGLVQAGVTTITFKNTWQSDTDAAPAIINQSATGVTMDRGQPDVVVSAANRVYQEGADLTGSNGKTLAKGEVLVWSFDVTPVTIVDKADRHFRFSLWDGESDGFSARVDWGAAGGTVLNMGWNNNAATAESIGNYKYGTLIQSSVSPTLDLGQTTTPVHFEVSILKNAINATTYDVTLKIDDLILTHQFTGVDRFNDVSLAGFLMSDEQASSFTVSNMSMQVIPKPAISNVRSSPSANSDILLGGESADTSSQTVKYNALLNEALLGQTFTLASIGAAEDYKLTDLYLKAGSSEDWDLTSGNFEIKILQGTGGAVLGTYSYDAKAKGNGVGNDHVTDDWLKFSLDTGLVLADGGVYSFQAFWSAADDDNNWGFRRDKLTDTIPNGGGYYGDTTYIAADWNTSNPWNGMKARDVTQDQMFYVEGSVIAALTPTAPTDLTATVNGADIDLTWTDNSSNEVGFYIYRSFDGGTFDKIHTITGANVEQYTFTPDSGSGSYSFKVSAYNAYGESTLSSPTSSGIDLRAYQAADGVYVEFVAYDVEADGTIRLALMNADGSVAWEGSVDVTAGPRFYARFLVPGLELGGSYNFQVRDEVGKWWDADGVTVHPFAAEMVSASLAGIELSFDSQPEHDYAVQWVPTLGSSWQTLTNLTGQGAQTTVVVPHPDPDGAAGFFRVRLK